MELLELISERLQAGKAKEVKQLVQQAINEGIAAQDILEQGLLSGMSVIGEKFKKNEVFVPEVLVAARAMNRGAELLNAAEFAQPSPIDNVHMSPESHKSLGLAVAAKIKEILG